MKRMKFLHKIPKWFWIILAILAILIYNIATTNHDEEDRWVDIQDN